MSATEPDIAESLRRLRVAPVRIAAATDGVGPDRLVLRTDAEPWSVNDIVAHLRAEAEVRERFIDAMSTGKRASLSYQSPRSERVRVVCAELSFAENLAEFIGRRASLVERLERLPAGAWSLGALIRDRPETVATYVGYLVEHEAIHCDQIEALLASGPQEQAG